MTDDERPADKMALPMVKHPFHISYRHVFILLWLVENVTIKDPPDVLDRPKCLAALAALRHAKWFQVRIYLWFTFQPYVFFFLYIFLYV